MEKLIFEEDSFCKHQIEVITGLASPYKKAGDTLWSKVSKNLTVLSVCDGVSSSESPSESSKSLVVFFEKYFKSKKSFNLQDYLEALKNTSLELSYKNYSSTLSQVVIERNRIYVFNFGDSQVQLFNKDQEMIYESYPQNIGFSNSVANPDSHIILNWIGNSQFKFEMSIFNRDDVSSGFIFSDGLLDLMDIKSKALNELKKSLTKEFDEISDHNLLDDSSFILFNLI